MVSVYFIAGMIAAFLIGLTEVLDKFALATSDNTSKTLAVFITIVMGVVAVGVGIVFNLQPVSMKSLVVLSLSGLLYVLPLFLFYKAIEFTDVSTASTVTSSEGIMMPAFAIIFLGETPTLLEGVGIIAIWTGVMLVTIVKNDVGEIEFNTGFWIVMAAVVLWSAQDTLINIVLPQMNTTTAFFWVRVTASVFGLLIFGVQSDIRTGLYNGLKNPVREKLHYIAVSGVISSAAMYAILYGYKNGAMSIVSPLFSTHIVFTLFLVFFIQYVSGVQLEKRASKNMIVRKIIAVLLVTIGMLLLS